MAFLLLPVRSQMHAGMGSRRSNKIDGGFAHNTWACITYILAAESRCRWGDVTPARTALFAHSALSCPRWGVKVQRSSQEVFLCFSLTITASHKMVGALVMMRRGKKKAMPLVSSNTAVSAGHKLSLHLCWTTISVGLCVFQCNHHICEHTNV